MEATHGEGVDCVIECIGHAHDVAGRDEPLQQAVQMIRTAGAWLPAARRSANVRALQDAGAEGGRADRVARHAWRVPARHPPDVEGPAAPRAAGDARDAHADVTSAFAHVDREDASTIKVVLDVQQA